MKTRVAVLQDIPAICRLYEEFYAYNAALQPKYYNAAKEEGAYPHSVIVNTESALFVAVDENDNDKITGFIHAEKSKTPPYPAVVAHEYVEIIDLIVLQSYRRKGIGSLLMNEAKNWGKSLGLEYIELLVLEKAESAKKFYEQEGFEVVSQTMRYEI